MRAIFILILLLLTGFVSSQDKAAAKILDGIADKYNAYSSIQVDIDMTVVLAEETPQNSEVTITQQGEKFVFLHPQQSMYCNGTGLWLYITDHNEVQINDYDQEEGDDYMISPRDLLKQYKSGKYAYELIDKKGSLANIQFKPLEADSDYSKYLIVLDTKKKEINEITAFGKDGSRVILVIKDMVTNENYKADYFDFDASKFPDVRIEDLRLD